MTTVNNSYIRNINGLLIFILCLKIAGYFSIVEDRGINQVFKIITRVGMTGLIAFLQFKLSKFGCLPTFKYKNTLSPLLYGLYLLLGFASFSWSTDPKYSALQWIMVVESLTFVILFMRVVAMVNFYFPKKQINLVQLFVWGIFPIMIVFFIGSIAFPDLFWRGMRGGEEYRLGGYLMNPNELGMLSSIAAAMGYIHFQKTEKKVITIISMLTALAVLGMTSSRYTAIGFFLIIGILILQSDNRKLKVGMFASMAIALPFILKFVIFKDGGGVEEVMSMTGRLPFWKALLNEGIVKEPFFGYGFMRINYTDYFQGLNTYPAKMTHNTFMQVLMNLGFVGFFIAFWQLITTIRNYFKEKNSSSYGSFFIALFIPIFINSITEFGIFGETNYGILFYQFLILLFVIEIRTNWTFQEKVKFKLFKKNNPSFFPDVQIME